MIKDIVTDVEKLSIRSDECDVRKQGQEIHSAVLDLKDTMEHLHLPILSAIQIGIPLRILMININGDYKALCNPMITQASGFSISRESDPCFGDDNYIVPRCNNVTVNYLNPIGKPDQKQLLGIGAYLLQQAIDHLEGVFISDIGMKIDDDFDSASEDEKAQVLKLYLDSINVKYTDLINEINNDPEQKKLNDAINYMRARDSGEIEVEPIYEEREDDK